MPRTHPPYAPEYRRRIIEPARAGRSIARLAREFEPSANAIRKWVKQAALDELRKQMEYPELKRAVREQCQIHHATVVLIEDRASGTQLIQELRKEGFRVVKPFAPEGDKIMRMNAQTATIENGFVHLPREASWLNDYLREVTAFPYAINDDQADSTSQALAWFNQAPPANGVIEYYRQDRALDLYRQGHSIEAIAVQVDRSREQVLQWMIDRNMRSAGQRSQNMVYKNCAHCGEAIFYNTSPYTRQGDLYYHDDCSRKLMFGT